MEAVISAEQEKVASVTHWLSQRIIGQDTLLARLMTALLCGGHLLVEGAPGLAKTRAIKELASAVDGDFHRIQFTPDLLPSDITGTEVYRAEDGSFQFQHGPVFHNLLLADEVNRAPAKVQSALLEAMAERQVSVGRQTFPLPELFLVMATQNPIEQEGTYPLPEAQMDRFLMHVMVDYPDEAAEAAIMRLVRSEEGASRQEKDEEPEPRIPQQIIFEARQEIRQVHVAEGVEQYITALIAATRFPERYNDELATWLDFGASPRGSIALDRCARARAWLYERDYATPDDVRDVVHGCLRHRLGLSYEASADGVTPEDVLDEIVKLVAVA